MYVIKKEFRNMFKRMCYYIYNDKYITMDLNNGVLIVNLKNGKQFPVDRYEDIKFLIEQGVAEHVH